MIEGLERAANAIQSAQARHQVVAHNLAYMDTTGFRRTVIAVEKGEANGSNQGNTEERLVERRDFSPGVFETTGRSLDVAIDGDGFFVLDGPDGDLFTRAGVFFVGENQQLVATNGLSVQGQGGPITVPPDLSPSELIIGADGIVTARNAQIGQLRVVSFADNDTLSPVGTAMFDGAKADQVPADASIRQGVRERSNVSPVVELTRMIIGMRHHEAAQRAITTISDSLQQRTQPQGG